MQEIIYKKLSLFILLVWDSWKHLLKAWLYMQYNELNSLAAPKDGCYLKCIIFTHI